MDTFFFNGLWIYQWMIPPIITFFELINHDWELMHQLLLRVTVTTRGCLPWLFTTLHMFGQQNMNFAQQIQILLSSE